MSRIYLSKVGSKDAVTKAFAKFINDNQLNSQQQYFINEIISYVEKNGLVEDNSQFIQALYDDYPSYEIFPSDEQYNDFNAIINSFRDNALFFKIDKKSTDNTIKP